MAFDITKIQGLTEMVDGAARIILSDIERRKSVGGVRSITVKMVIDPETLMVRSTVKVGLPKEDHEFKVQDVFAYRENGELNIDEDQQEPLFPQGSLDHDE